MSSSRVVSPSSHATLFDAPDAVAPSEVEISSVGDILPQAVSGESCAIDQGRGISEPLPPGLGMEEHVKQAQRLAAPFPPSATLSDGLQAAVVALAQHDA